MDLAYLTSPKALKLAAAAKAEALSVFKKRFPRADRFTVQVDFDEKHKATGEVFFTEAPGSLQERVRYTAQVVDPSNERHFGIVARRFFPFVWLSIRGHKEQSQRLIFHKL